MVPGSGSRAPWAVTPSQVVGPEPSAPGPHVLDHDSQRKGTGLPRPLAAMYVFFSSWRFPVLMLAVLASFDLFQVLMLVIPKSATGIGAFAEEFRIWCYGKNDATGKLIIGYVVLFLAQPAVMCLALGVVWYKQLVFAARAQRRAMIPYLGVALVLVAGICYALVGVGGKSASGASEPFPAAALRTAKPAPAVSLLDHEGNRVDLRELRGNVVIVTGIYATCFHTCPLIMAELKRALGALDDEQRRDVRVVAITLDPERDTGAVLARTATRYQVTAPEFRLLHGSPAEVNAALDRLEIARSKNPMSGEIDHANLFIVLDRQGQVAYRLTLGERQEKWLVEALRLLTAEPRPVGG
jgi:protein SCO1/2